jgi:hypothetical protein
VKQFPNLNRLRETRSPSPYAAQMAASIAGLLRLFDGKVPDPESNARVLEVAVTPQLWGAGHAVRDVIRDRLLAAMEEGDDVKCAQYGFEESCLESLYNEVQPEDPFDSVSPYRVVPGAFGLARLVGVANEDVLEVMTPESW